MFSLALGLGLVLEMAIEARTGLAWSSNWRWGSA